MKRFTSSTDPHLTETASLILPNASKILLTRARGRWFFWWGYSPLDRLLTFAVNAATEGSWSKTPSTGDPYFAAGIPSGIKGHIGQNAVERLRPGGNGPIPGSVE